MSVIAMVPLAHSRFQILPETFHQQVVVCLNRLLRHVRSRPIVQENSV
jgi:hypothetical protein